MFRNDHVFDWKRRLLVSHDKITNSKYDSTTRKRIKSMEEISWNISLNLASMDASATCIVLSRSLYLFSGNPRQPSAARSRSSVVTARAIGTHQLKLFVDFPRHEHVSCNCNNFECGTLYIRCILSPWISMETRTVFRLAFVPRTSQGVALREIKFDYTWWRLVSKSVLWNFKRDLVDFILGFHAEQLILDYFSLFFAWKTQLPVELIFP